MKKIPRLLIPLILMIWLGMIGPTTVRGADFIVHRGDMIETPENTMAAFQTALSKGAQGCEIDVRTTKDNVLVLLHDATLKRTGGRDVLISDLTWDECQKVEVGSWKDPKFKGEKIPSLDDTLAFMQKNNMYPLLDVKETALEKKIIVLLQKHRLSDRALFIAYSVEQSQRLKDLDPRVTPMIQTFPKKGESEDAFFGRVMKMLHNGNTKGLFTGKIRSELMQKFHKESVRVLFGTTHNRQQTDDIRKAGFDYIIVDDPETIKEKNAK